MSSEIEYPSVIAGVGGSRNAMRAMGKALCEQANDRLLTALADPEREERFVRALDAGFKNRDRTCMSLYAQMRQLVGTQVDLAVHVVQVVGAPPERARGAVDMLNVAEALDERELVRRCAERVRAYCSQHAIEGVEIPEL